MNPKWLFVGTVVGLILLILGIVIGWAVAPPLIEEKIKESTAIVEGTDQFERFEALPVPLTFKVYIFTIENRDEITAGEKPIIKQVGPYVYKQFRTKQNIKFVDDDRKIQFEQRQLYEFDEEASKPLKETDVHLIVNLPLIVAFKKLKALIHTWTETTISQVFDLPLTDMFIEVSVKDFLFDGIKMCTNATPLPCTGLKIQVPSIPTLRFDENGGILFSFFHFKNYTSDGVWEVSSGIDDISKVGSIESWNGDNVVTTWGTEPNACNLIKGTDSSIFPPFRVTEGQLTIFSTDICRSVNIAYVGKSEYAGIESYRYETTEEFLSEYGEVEGNECFCLNQTTGVKREDGCLFKGAMEMRNCLSAEVVLTLPHFLGADQQYKDSVVGLSPDEYEHKIFVELEPHTGTPLRGGKRAQFNVFLEDFQDTSIKIDWTANFNNSLLPVLWIDEGIELNDEMIDMLNERLLTNLVILDAVKYTLIAVGAVMALGFTVLYFCIRNRGSENV